MGICQSVVYILGRPCNSLLECYSISVQKNGVILQQTEKFSYLGDTFSSGGRYNNELDTRIKRAIALMCQFFRLVALKQDLCRKAKLSVFRSIFVPIITNGHECWIMTKIVRSRVQAAKMYFLHNIAVLSLFEKVQSADISGVVEWLKHRTDDQHGLGSKPTYAFCCVLGKDTLRHFPLLGGLGKQFEITVISLLNY